MLKSKFFKHTLLKASIYSKIRNTTVTNIIIDNLIISLISVWYVEYQRKYSHRLKFPAEELGLPKQNGTSTSVSFLGSLTASCGWHGSRSRFLSSASYVFVSREWRRGKSVWATCPRHVARHVTGFLPLSTWAGWGRREEGEEGWTKNLRRRRFSRVSESTRAYPQLPFLGDPGTGGCRWSLRRDPRSRKRAPSPPSPYVHGEWLPRVTCGCRKSGDLPAGSCSRGRYPGNKFERGRAFAKLNATRWLR